MPRSSPLLASAAFVAAFAAATPALASTGSEGDSTARSRRLPYRAVEAQGVVYSHLLPRPGFGVDGAFVFGWPGLQARIGAIGVGVLPFELGQGKIGNVLGAGQADVCVARNVLQHQIRMCAGGQGGVMAHQWDGYTRPKKKLTPWGAGTLKGDYRLGLTERFGLLAGVGVVVPFVGPTFRAYDDYGTPSPLVFPGPVAGFVSLGTSFRW